jgi:hypothetical protein
MLEELLHKMQIDETYHDDGCGVDWNESGYYD